jgi:hypothetical protein
MIKKNILSIVLLSSSILASDDLASIKTERSDKIDFNFSFGLNKPDQENTDIRITIPEDSNLYEGLAHNWKNISNTFGQIFFSDILPFAVQLQQLVTKLKENPEFQKLVKNNLEKLKNSASAFALEVGEKFAQNKELQELVKKNVEKFTISAAPLITEIADKAANIAGYKEEI